MTVHIRRARPDQLEAAGDVVLEAYLADGRLTRDDPYAAHLRDARGRAEDSIVLVALEDGAVLGSVTWCPPGSSLREIALDGEGEFRALGVLPSAQGRGIGEQLVHACVELARQEADHAVVLSSGDWMRAAHRLYERLGFVRLPERDWTPVPGVLLLAYRLDLSER